MILFLYLYNIPVTQSKAYFTVFAIAKTYSLHLKCSLTINLMSSSVWNPFSVSLFKITETGLFQGTFCNSGHEGAFSYRNWISLLTLCFLFPMTWAIQPAFYWLFIIISLSRSTNEDNTVANPTNRTPWSYMVKVTSVKFFLSSASGYLLNPIFRINSRGILFNSQQIYLYKVWNFSFLSFIR